MYYVYILRSIKSPLRLYIGHTENLERRLAEHRAGNCHSTVRMGGFRLIFYEAFVAKGDAQRREAYFKTTNGKKALRLIIRDSLALTGSVTVAQQTLDLLV